MAMIPVAEYQRLAAAAAEAAEAHAYDEVKRRRGAHAEETIPAEFAKRLSAGENALRVWREYRGLSQKELAAMTGLSGAFLSQIETGARRGRIGAIVRIANALRVSLDDLVPA